MSRIANSIVANGIPMEMPLYLKLKTVDKYLFHEEVQVSRVFADEERLQVMEENRVKCIQPAMPNRNTLRTVARPHPA